MRASAKGHTSEDDFKGKPVPVPGTYHVIITSVNDSRTKKDGSPLDATIVEMEVLAGTVPGQEKKTITAFYNLDDNGEETAEYCEKISRLCMAAGILKAGEERDVDPEGLKDQQVVVRYEEYTTKAGKKGASIGNFGLDVWGINHPEMASVPKNQDAIRLLRENRGKSGNVSGGSTATEDI